MTMLAVRQRVGGLVAMWVIGLTVAACGAPGDPDPDESDSGGEISTKPVCSLGPIRCLSYVRTVAGTRRIKAHATMPSGLGAPDLQDAYNVDPTKTATAHPTVAIVNAYGYAALESDLAAYRTQYGLPDCSVANGCLKIVNQQGQTSPLPGPPPADDDWTVEGSLDLDMASAGCPLCHLLVVEADDSNGASLYAGEDTAAAMGPDVISNSWGGPENASVTASESHFTHPNIAIFTAAGDAGYNDQFQASGTGPDYPGTSAQVISVGATRLTRSATAARGWTETAWAVTGLRDKSAGGSACSLSIPKPAYQTDSPCKFKATTDISAVGDPATGVAIYNAGSDGWLTVGGTSASSPFIAAIFAATGNGSKASGAFIKANADRLNDVVSGNNGTCTDNSKLCNAGAGWDGPTGYGTPDAAKLLGAPAGGDGGGGGGGCAVGGTGAGFGALLGLGLLALRRRRA